jgi:hypothetical protein
VETLVTVHSWVRWLVLAALVGGAVLGLIRYRNKAEWESSLFQLGVMTVDIQIAIGIVIWFERKGWNYSFFFKVLHPAFMLLALAIAHIGLALAKRRSDARSYLLASGSFVLALVLIIGAIPWDRL